MSKSMSQFVLSSEDKKQIVLYELIRRPLHLKHAFSRYGRRLDNLFKELYLNVTNNQLVVAEK